MNINIFLCNQLELMHVKDDQKDRNPCATCNLTKWTHDKYLIEKHALLIHGGNLQNKYLTM